MPDAFLSQLTASALVVYAIEQLKRSHWFPWITAESKVLARLLSGVGAAVSAFGVHTAMEGSAGVGWSLTIHIPPLLIVLHAAWDWLNQMALNQLVYDGVAAPTTKKG